jgi:hypothetical protein
MWYKFEESVVREMDLIGSLSFLSIDNPTIELWKEPGDEKTGTYFVFIEKPSITEMTLRGKEHSECAEPNKEGLVQLVPHNRK